MLMIAHAAQAHTVSWINGKIYDYAVLTKGKNCCHDLGRECRPAFSYTKVSGGWRLEIPVDGHNPYGARTEVTVPDTSVTSQDLGRDGVAHVCALQSGDEWNVYCTFVPPGFVQIAPPPDHLETLLTGAFRFCADNRW